MLREREEILKFINIHVASFVAFLAALQQRRKCSEIKMENSCLRIEIRCLCKIRVYCVHLVSCQKVYWFGILNLNRN